MIIPLIVTGHTSCKDKSTIINSRGACIDVIANVELCKKNNSNLKFYTIYSIDDTIQDSKYIDYFDKVLYSENVPHKYVGEKVKVETGLNYILSEKKGEYDYFIKSSSRVILLNTAEQYIDVVDKYDHIGGNHQTGVQYDTCVFIGNKKLIDVWISCGPSISIVSSIKTEANWLSLYGRLLLENLFYNCCKKHKIKSLLVHDLYTCKFI